MANESNKSECRDPPEGGRGNPLIKHYAKDSLGIFQLKKINLLTPIRRFGVTTLPLADGWIGNDSRTTGFVAKLAKKGLVQLINSHFFGKEFPQKLVMLTAAGVAEAEKHFTPTNRYELNPEKLNFDTMFHDLQVQELTMRKFTQGHIHAYTVESEIGPKKTSKKRPDAIWEMTNGDRFMVEVELSGKWKRDFDEFCRRVITGLVNEEYLMLVLASTSQAILDRYSKKLQPGQLITLWQKTKTTNLWVTAGKYRIPQTLEGKIICIKLS